MSPLLRSLAPVALVAIIDGALLGGVAAIITSLGGILAVVLSYRHGKAAGTVGPAPDDDGPFSVVIEALERELEHERDENRSLRSELREQRDPPARRRPRQ